MAALVALGVLAGHRGRIGFAIATQAFLLLAGVVIVSGAFADSTTVAPAPTAEVGGPLLANAGLAAILLALPLGMALATGVEAPSNAIAELPRLGDRGRRRFGRGTLWAMVSIVGVLTICFSVLVVELGVPLPGGDSTLLADVARAAVGDGFAFGAFQLFSALLLLAAAASSYLAGSGVLKALSAVGIDGAAGLLPKPLRRENRFLVSHWGVVVVFLVAAAMILAAGGHEQVLVKFYAVSVFASFLAATLACARLSLADGSPRRRRREPGRGGPRRPRPRPQPDPPRFGDRTGRFADRPLLWWPGWPPVARTASSGARRGSDRSANLAVAG